MNLTVDTERLLKGADRVKIRAELESLKKQRDYIQKVIPLYERRIQELEGIEYETLVVVTFIPSQKRPVWKWNEFFFYQSGEELVVS